MKNQKNKGSALSIIIPIIAIAIIGGSIYFYFTREIKEIEIEEIEEAEETRVLKPDCLNYNIGDDYKGGKLAWCGEYNDEWKALISANSDQAYDVEWGCYDVSNPKNFETQEKLFTGNKNTYNILKGCDEEPIAASIASNYEGGGYTDWYLPSIEELRILHQNKEAIGGFITEKIHPVKGSVTKYDYWSGSYWSSTEVNNNLVFDERFYELPSDDYLPEDSMNVRFIGGLVRAVRSINVPLTKEVIVDELEKEDKLEKIVEISVDHDFPIISAATLIKTEFIPPCDIPEWLSYCNVDVYTYEMELNIDKIDKWLLEEAEELGWSCFSGDVAFMEERMIVGFHTECKKEETTYGLKVDRDDDIVQVKLFVPRGDSLY